MDITEVILKQHAEQRQMFAQLDEVDRSDTATLTALWQRLEILLENHAEAEEKYFYPPLLQVGKGASDASDAPEEVEDAVKDHNNIRDA
ncbi:MAG TPA: hemerythrin domain-containing protein, partial [Segeticoccus sp.]|nr:hemerythrin domain-containing protein [Segeticoccus sp.]